MSMDNDGRGDQYEKHHKPVDPDKSAHRVSDWKDIDTYAKLPDRMVTEYEAQVRFDDGAAAIIKGRLGVILPKAEGERLEMVKKFGFTSREDMETRLLIPAVSMSLKNTATTMSAFESMGHRRAEFVELANEQISGGLYELEKYKVAQEYEAKNEETGKVEKKVREIYRMRVKFDQEGDPVHYGYAPLKGAGISVWFFEVVSFEYDSMTERMLQQKRLAAEHLARAKVGQQLAIVEAEKRVAEAKAQAELREAERLKIIAERDKAMAESDALREMILKEVEKAKAEKMLIEARAAARAAAEKADKELQREAGK